MKPFIIVLLARLTNLKIHRAKEYVDNIKKIHEHCASKVNSKRVLVVEAHDLLYCALFSVISASSQKHFFSFSPMGLSTAVGNTQSAKLRRKYLIYVKDILWRYLYKLNFQRVNVSYSGLSKFTSRANTLYLNFKASDDKANFHIDGIRVGDLVVDTYVRFCPSPIMNYDDPFLIEIFKYLLITRDRFEKALEKVQPEEIYVNYTVYLEYGIPVRVALQKGLKVRAFGNDHATGQLLTKNWPYHTPNVNQNYAEKRAYYIKKPSITSFGERELRKRTSGYLDESLNYMPTTAFKQTNQRDSKLRNVCVIYAHHFSDSAHIYPNFLYDTFYDWLSHTKHILESNQQSYAIKPHPKQGPAEIQVLERLVTRSEYGHLLSGAVSNNLIYNSKIKFALTAYGTISHELSYLKIPVISCSDNPHSAFSFNIQARSKLEYSGLIQKAARDKILYTTKYKDESALFYCVHNYPPDWRERVRMKQVRALRNTLANEDINIWPSIHDILERNLFS